MQTQHHTRNKSFHPSQAAQVDAQRTKPVALAKPAVHGRQQVPRFRIVKPHESFRLHQVVHQFTGPTYDVDVPGEVSVTVVPGVGPFVGLTPDYLERIG